MRFTLAALVISLIGCAAPAATSQAAPPPEPIVAPSPPSEAAVRADALLEDMRRKQEAQAQFDRENPYKETSTTALLDQYRRGAEAADRLSATAAPSAPVSGATAAAAEPAKTVLKGAVSTNIIAGEHDERWWKNEMHTRVMRYDESVARMNAARASMTTAKGIYDRAPNRIERAEALRGYQDAEAAFQLAVRQAGNDQREIDGFRDQARRESVPPGWLLWP